MPTVKPFASTRDIAPCGSVRVASSGNRREGSLCSSQRSQHRCASWILREHNPTRSGLSPLTATARQSADAQGVQAPDLHRCGVVRSMPVREALAQGPSLEERALRAAATAALSAGLLFSAVSPTLAIAPDAVKGSVAERQAPGAGANESLITPAFLPDKPSLAPEAGKGSSGTSSTDESLTADERETVALFERNTPSVVNISNLAAARSRYSMDVMTVPQGSGSGFIWDDKGHVITNFHVVRGASALKVALYDSTTVDASIVGVDENKDIAVLKLDVPASKAQALKRVALGRSTGLAVGQKVFAIGNPFGLDHTLTAGLVSGLQREIQATQFGPKIKGVIQTDAAINPGNSGGVLLNSRGQLIGVNSAILDPSQRGSFSGVGFAIPIDMVKGLVEQILQYGRVIRPVLGITMGPPALIARLNVDGVLVYDVPDGSPAARAGILGCGRTRNGDLQLGDIIVGMNGKDIMDYGDVFEVLDGLKPGDKVSLELLRPMKAGKREAVEVTLSERSPSVQDG